MEIGTVINIEELKKSRVLDAKEMIKYLQVHRQRFWCWGATAWTVITDKKEHMALRFYVTGLLFKGHVYLRCNGRDLMDVYFTTTKGTILNKIEDVFIEDLFDHMDKIIEIKGQY